MCIRDSSYSRCEVKVIDLGSSRFVTDRLSSYVQSRAYRAPEVILGLPWGAKIDIWSLGCLLAELSSGSVLFQAPSAAGLLARVVGTLGPLPRWMVARGRHSHRYFADSSGRTLYAREPRSGRYEALEPQPTSLRRRVPQGDGGFLDFLAYLLTPDPRLRPTAEEALRHPWLRFPYALEGGC
jgi:dual specificity tyrosine-phosphorylation-regulated kinase 2/3/4